MKRIIMALLFILAVAFLTQCVGKKEKPGDKMHQEKEQLIEDDEDATAGSDEGGSSDSESDDDGSADEE